MSDLVDFWNEQTQQWEQHSWNENQDRKDNPLKDPSFAQYAQDPNTKVRNVGTCSNKVNNCVSQLSRCPNSNEEVTFCCFLQDTSRNDGGSTSQTKTGLGGKETFTEISACACYKCVPKRCPSK